MPDSRNHPSPDPSLVADQNAQIEDAVRQLKRDFPDHTREQLEEAVISARSDAGWDQNVILLRAREILRIGGQRTT